MLKLNRNNAALLTLDSFACLISQLFKELGWLRWNMSSGDKQTPSPSPTIMPSLMAPRWILNLQIFWGGGAGDFRQSDLTAFWSVLFLFFFLQSCICSMADEGLCNLLFYQIMLPGMWGTALIKKQSHNAVLKTTLAALCQKTKQNQITWNLIII